MFLMSTSKIEVRPGVEIGRLSLAFHHVLCQEETLASVE